MTIIIHSGRYCSIAKALLRCLQWYSCHHQNNSRGLHNARYNTFSNEPQENTRNIPNMTMYYNTCMCMNTCIIIVQPNWATSYRQLCIVTMILHAVNHGGQFLCCIMKYIHYDEKGKMSYNYYIIPLLCTYCSSYFAIFCYKKTR